jgi:predicted glycoside hydrolase/deacetylase ChbG (UPF0249 family)
MIPVALCADDYGISPGVDDGILALAEHGRITAFSCMTASPRWQQAATRLAPLFGKCDIGLHLTLTQLAPLGAMPKLAPDGRFPQMGKLYLDALMGRLDVDEIVAEVGRQIDAFSAATGRAPDFLDGHHHVHQLPVVRTIVAETWRRRGLHGWIRNTATSPRQIIARGVAMPRAAVLAIFGDGARRTWKALGIATNADFSGVRNFDEPPPFGALMQRYLKNARSGLLVMCHPGTPDEELGRIDHVTAPRAEELRYLSSDEFSADLAAAGCELVRLSALAAR